MSGAGVSVEGVTTVLERFVAVEQNGRRATEVALERFGLLIERIAKTDYVPVVTGRLKASIGGHGEAPQQPGDAVFLKGWTGSTYTVVVGSNVIYAPIIEFGRNPARHGSPRARAEYARDKAADARRVRSKPRHSNGRHGPFLRPAVAKAMAAGVPVLKEQFAAIFKGLGRA